ncbi:hypothetical protein BVC80_1835g350 [Macleaya cordata]|uniref:Uncharacterized protein n=1 Tax=Macleaya cordata TaxID=56857 RepID=A0A200R5G6_MACCD|nr:hypothetical protein BVC80_1835g350 [Macleaya cordata]
MSSTMQQRRILLSALLLLFLTLPASVRASSSRHVLKLGSGHYSNKPRPARNLVAADPVEGLHAKHHKPKFRPGPWKNAHATFYGEADGSGTEGRY